MDTWETAAANYAAQQQAMGFPNMQSDAYGQYGQDAAAWEQWQAEYGQWQAQYGDQYDQSMQVMGGQMGLNLGAPPPPPPPEEASDYRGGGRGGRGGFRGNQRGGRGGQARGGQQQSWAGNQQQQQSWGGNQQQRGGRGNQQQQGGRGGQQQKSWGQGGAQQQWGNQGQQWSQGWEAEEQGYGGRGRGRGGRGGGGRGGSRGGGFGGNFQGGQFGSGNQFPGRDEQSWSQPEPEIPRLLPKLLPANLTAPEKPAPAQVIAPPSPAPIAPKQTEGELSEAEKEFDQQFKNWEDQFNTWKEENKNHPDRQQYDEYEKKMEKFRAQLLSRREQMRKKREQEESAMAGPEVSSTKPWQNKPQKPTQPPLQSPVKLSQPTPPTMEEQRKSQAAKTFADNWAKDPPVEEKPKLKSIQQTMLEMASYITPKTNTGPPCVTLEEDKMKSPLKSAAGIPGLDLGHDSMMVKGVKEDDEKPPGTESVPLKPPEAKHESLPKPELSSSQYPNSAAPPAPPIASPSKPSPAATESKNPPMSSPYSNPGQGPDYGEPASRFQGGFNNRNQQGPAGQQSRPNDFRQNQYDNYDEYGDETQDMAAMHEMFSEDEPRGFGGPQQNFRGPRDGSGDRSDNFRGPGGSNEQMRGPSGGNEDWRGPSGPNDNSWGGSMNSRGQGGPPDSDWGPGGPNLQNDNLRNLGGPNENRGPGGPNVQGPGGPNDAKGPNDNLRGRDGPNDHMRGPGGPNDFNRGPAGPNENSRGRGGPNDFNRGPGGPNENIRGPGGPNNFNRGSGGPNDFNRGPGGPNESMRGPGGPNDFNRGPGGPNDDISGPDKGSSNQNYQLRPSELNGSLPNDFNPWLDLGSDDELTPDMFDARPRGPGPMNQQNFDPRDEFQSRDGPQGRPGNWQDGPGFANDNRRQFRDEPSRDWNDRGRFDDRDMGRPYDMDGRGPPRPLRDDRGFGFDQGGPGGWKPDVPPQVQPRPEWEDQEEYKAKTVIEYDHQTLNIVTPAITPANVPTTSKKKVIFKEPSKILEYSHSWDSDPRLVTQKSGDYDPAKKQQWEEEERRRKDQEERDRYQFKENRSRTRRGNRGGNQKDKDRNPQNRDSNQPERDRSPQDRNRDRRDRERNPQDRADFQGRDREGFREGDGREHEDVNRPRDRDRMGRNRDEGPNPRDRPDSRNQDDSRDARSQRSLSPRGGPNHSRNRGPNRDLNQKTQNAPNQSAPPGKNNSQPSGPQPGRKLFNIPDTNVETIQVEDLLCLPGRVQRPNKFSIFMRGPPGSGKSFAAKLIKDKEVENGGNAPRILNLDDYFMAEVETEVQDPETGRKVKTKEMKYEYEKEMEGPYRASLVKAFKKTVDEGYFPIIIVDCVNDKVSQFDEMWRYAQSKSFKSYVVELEADAQTCAKQNEHGRTLEEIEKIIKSWEPTPATFARLDITSILQRASINEVEMEDMSMSEEEAGVDEEAGTEDIFSALVDLPTSKWDKMDTEDKLAKLDGIKKGGKSKESVSMDDWLGLEEMNDAPLEPGTKRVRWADIVERKEQEKMRAIGFVVGQTDWGRMMDPTFGGGALTKTKYI